MLFFRPFFLFLFLFPVLCFAQETNPSIPFKLSLEEAEQRTLAHYEKFKIAQTEILEARGQKLEASSAVLPSLSANYQYSRNLLRPSLFLPIGKLTLGSENSHEVNLTFNQPLFGFGRIRHNLKAAQKNVEAAIFSAAQTKSDVLYELREAYLNALLARERLKVALASLAQASENLRREEKRFQVGEISEFELNRFRLEKENKALALEKEKNEGMIALKRIKRLVQIDPDQEILLTDPLEKFATPFDAQEIADRLHASPQLASLQRLAESAEESRKGALASFFPLLTSFANYRGQGESPRFIPRDQELTHAVSLGINLAIPLFDGGITWGRYKAQEARALRAGLQKQLVEKDLALLFDQALSQAKIQWRKIQTSKRSLELAQTLFAQSKLRFQNGLISFIELKDVNQSLEQSRLEYAISLYEYALTRAKIEQILGEVRSYGLR